jgi:DNA (cytosine-5)-methyltransferase 1
MKENLNELALFAGAGGGILGGHLLGWRTVCAVEWEPYPASVLAARQNDGFLPPFPIWDDVQTFDGKPWQGIVDVVSGGFPCQDISAAGKGAGIDGERSGMWGEMARIIHEVRPQFVFVENSPMLTSRGLGRVLGDLASMGFDAKWGVLGAADVGANHQRDRIWIVAKVGNASGIRGQNYSGSISTKDENSEKNCRGRGIINASQDEYSRTLAYADSTYGERNQCSQRSIKKPAEYEQPSWWQVEPDVGRVANGVAARMDRLKAIGNGQVPLCAATAWNILSNQ